MRWVWTAYLRKYKWLLLFSALLMAIEGSSLGAISYMVKPMFDTAFSQGNENALWAVGLIITGIFVLRGITSVLHKVIMTAVAQNASTDLRIDMLGHLMRQDNAFHQTHPPGFLIQRVQSDVQSINGVWAAFITGVGRDFISLIALLGVAISVDWKWTVVACVGTPLLVLPTLAAQRFIRKRSREARDLGAGLATQLDEVFHGIVPTKLNLLEEYQAKKFRIDSKQLVRAEVRARFGSASIAGMVDLTAGLGFFCVLIYGGGEIIAGEKTIGQFMSFFTAIAMMFEPLRRLGGMTGLWQVAASSIERIKELLDVQPTLVDPTNPLAPPKETPGVELSNVHLAYGDATVLQNTSFVAEAGKTTAIVGASGAGKSTVFNILTRLVDPQSGSVKVGGVSNQDLSLADLRGLFSVVSQDALLFDETLRENILLGQTNVNDTRLQDVLKAAHVADFLPKLPNGLDSEVGPRGSNLSGGQRQRTVIARALLRNTPILLLDEATSALDAQSETVVQQALDRLSKGRTTLVIAHRLSTVREADKIVVMDKGEVVDQGTHTELLARGGLYAELYNLQFNTEGETAEAKALKPVAIDPAPNARPAQSLFARALSRLPWVR
ncbi:ABC transporter ATP-binding protein [Shimia abyssi]|nr:ABC transporter ATP-binding protein [Shimia abyssi]